MSFYIKTLNKLITQGLLDPSLPTLVVAGGEADVCALRVTGFEDVTISNLDVRLCGNEFAPFSWSFQDAEALDFPDGSFAQVIIHAGLHHCASPHKALLEMYRVASRAAVVFEARDSALMRTSLRLGLGTAHEFEAVIAHGLRFGGWRNTSLPNFVYRWTEHEVEKTIAAYDPRGPIPIQYFYGLRLPLERLSMLTSATKRWLARVALIPVRGIFALARNQGNEFAFWIGKPKVMHPWLTAEGEPDRAWLQTNYKVTLASSANN